MTKFNINDIRKRFNKEEHQKRLESKLNIRLEKEKHATEKYLAHNAEDRRIANLKKKISDYRSIRGKDKKKQKHKVNIGGFRFEI